MSKETRNNSDATRNRFGETSEFAVHSSGAEDELTRQAEDAVRDSLSGHAHEARIPDFNDGLAAIMARVNLVPVNNSGRPGLRADSSRPPVTRADVTRPAATQRAARLKRWLAPGLLAILVIAVAVVVGLIKPLATNTPQPAVPAPTSAAPSPAPTPSSPVATPAALQALLLTNSELPTGVIVKSIDASDSIKKPAAWPTWNNVCGDVVPLDGVLTSLRGATDRQRAVATAAFDSSATANGDSKLVETIWSDPDRTVYAALNDTVARCSAATHKGVVWHTMRPSPDGNASDGVIGIPVTGLTYVTIILVPALDSDPTKLNYLAFGHAGGVTVLVTSLADATAWSDADIYNNAYLKVGGGAPAAASPAAGQTVCPNGLALPPGVSATVCGRAPADAGAVVPGLSFSDPSGKVLCSWVINPDDTTRSGVECTVTKPTFKQPAKPKDCHLDWNGTAVWIGAGLPMRGSCAGLTDAEYRVAHGEKLSELAYGSSLATDQVACSSSQAGVTCWNTVTHHGFQVSTSTQLTW